MLFAQDVMEVCTKEFLVPWEAYAKKLPNGDCLAYPDPGTGAEPWTIGYGSTFDDRGQAVKQGDVWTHDKAIRVKAIVLRSFFNTLMSMSPKLARQPVRRVAAVLSWAYNCGFGNYRVSSFKRAIDREDWSEAARQCLRWNKANGKVMRGLTRRREHESRAIANP